MEINIVADGQTDGRGDGTYVVTMGGRFTVTTTVTRDGDTVKEWIRHINKVYGKKGGGEIVVGLRGDRSMFYGGYCHYFDGNKGKKDDDVAFDLLQLCVGTHCLLFFDPDKVETVSWYIKRQNLKVKALTDFFWDPKNTFVGVGIEKTATKIERFIEGVAIGKRVELSELATEKGYLNQDINPVSGGGGDNAGGRGGNNNGGENGGRGGGRRGRGGGGGRCGGCGAVGKRRGVRQYGLSELARTVLGEEMNFVKPTKGIEYGKSDFNKYATAEVFLASQVGAKLLNNPHSLV